MSRFIIFTLISATAALECYVNDPTIKFSGFVNNPAWEYCTFSPLRSRADFRAGGLSNENDDLERYASMFAAIKAGSMSVDVPHVCFTEVYNIRKGERDVLHRCLCHYDRCNVFDEYPDFIKTPTVNHDHVINKSSISHEQFDKLHHYTRDTPTAPMEDELVYIKNLDNYVFSPKFQK